MATSTDRKQGSDTDIIRLALKEAKDLAHALEGTATSHLLVKAGEFQIEIEREAGAVLIAQGLQPTFPLGAARRRGWRQGWCRSCRRWWECFFELPHRERSLLVQVGDTVERGQKVGIVEAMKVMNDVTSDCRGVVTEILVEDATPVIYEQRLMLVDSAGSGSKG